MKNSPDLTDIESKVARSGNWSAFCARAPWSVVSSRELQKIYGVSLNTINSWRMRRILPDPVKHHALPPGNKNYYRIHSVRSIMEQRSEVEICWEWIDCWLADQGTTIRSLKQAANIVAVAYDLFGIERPLIPEDFSTLPVNRPSLEELIA